MKRSMIFFMILFLGCSGKYISPYPTEWSQLVNGESCPNISGYYENKGEVDPKSKEIGIGNLRLTAKILQNGNHGAEIVKIWQTERRLEITSLIGTEVVGSRVFQAGGEKEDFRCEAGHVVIKTEDSVARDGIVGKNWTTDSLMNSADGALIVHSENTGTGLFVFIPVRVKDARWYRYKRVQ